MRQDQDPYRRCSIMHFLCIHCRSRKFNIDVGPWSEVLSKLSRRWVPRTTQIPRTWTFSFVILRNPTCAKQNCCVSITTFSRIHDIVVDEVDAVLGDRLELFNILEEPTSRSSPFRKMLKGGILSDPSQTENVLMVNVKSSLTALPIGLACFRFVQLLSKVQHSSVV